MVVFTPPLLGQDLCLLQRVRNHNLRVDRFQEVRSEHAADEIDADDLVPVFQLEVPHVTGGTADTGVVGKDVNAPQVSTASFTASMTSCSYKMPIGMSRAYPPGLLDQLFFVVSTFGASA